MKIAHDRTVRLWGDNVTSYTTQLIMTKILELMAKDSKEQITLEISSPGGDFLAGLGLYDWLRGNRIPLQTVGYGQVSSMAVIIFLAGEHRVAGPNCYFFLHQPAKEYENGVTLNITAHEAGAKQLVRCRDQYVEVLMDRLVKPSNLKDWLGKPLTKDRLMEMIDDETRLNPEEALKIGMVHEVLSFK